MNSQSEERLRQQAIQARCFHPSGAWEEFPQSALDGSIVARFEKMVERYPTRLAVQTEDWQLTYAELNEQANRIAHGLLAQPGDRGLPVILLLDHAPIAVVALFGLLKAGNFYTFFDPTQPPARLQQKAVDSQAYLILTDRQHLSLASQINGSGAIILCIEQLTTTQLPGERVSTNPNLLIDADATAVILYTSGSTGNPKGILLTHRALLHRVKRQVNNIHLGCEDRYASLHPYDTIAGLRDLFCPLLTGATTCLFNLKVYALTQLPAWVQKHAITILGIVTPTLRRLLQQNTPSSAFAQVRLACIGGDTLYRQDVACYRQHFPPTCLLYNTFGTSETVGSFCYYLFDHQSVLPPDPLPVGYPMVDMQISIVDEVGQPVALGKIGEIALTTPYLAQGYWQQPALTANRFHPSALGATYLTGDRGLIRADGCLIHLGRQDNQVKIHGYRIEIGEIERCLLSHPSVQEAVIVSHEHQPGENNLVAYWVAKRGMTTTLQTLRRWLSASVPAHMIPSRFLLLDALPLTPSGKIDRRALPSPTANIRWERAIEIDTPYQPARTPLEAQLILIWQEVLDVEPVGIDDHFLDLGGNSLHAMQIHARLVNQVQGDLPARLLLECTTVAEMALLLTQRVAKQWNETELEELLTAVETFDQTEGSRHEFVQ